MRGQGDLTPFVFYASLDAPELRDEASLHDAQGCTNNPWELIHLIDSLVHVPAGQRNGSSGTQVDGGT